MKHKSRTLNIPIGDFQSEVNIRQYNKWHPAPRKDRSGYTRIFSGQFLWLDQNVDEKYDDNVLFYQPCQFTLYTVIVTNLDNYLNKEHIYVSWAMSST